MEYRGSSHSDDISLGSRLKERDPDALGDIYDAYGSSLYGMVGQMVQDEKTAEAVLQATFRIVWQEAAAYDSHKTSLFTWIMRIARKQARQHNPLRPDRATDALAHAHRQAPEARPEAIRQLLDHLSLEEQEVVSWVMLAGRTETEAAQQLSIPVNIVRNRLRTASLKLREILQTSP